MPGFADSPALVDVAEFVPAPAPSPVFPTLPAGQQLLEANLYTICDLITGRAARASSARQYRAIYRRFADALRDELGRCAELSQRARGPTGLQRAPQHCLPQMDLVERCRPSYR
jgi:hypothetical protein